MRTGLIVGVWLFTSSVVFSATINTDTYVVSNKSFCFSYPKGWKVKEVGPAVQMTNTEVDEELLLVGLPTEGRNAREIADCVIKVLADDNSGYRGFNWEPLKSKSASAIGCEVSYTNNQTNYQGYAVVLQKQNSSLWLSHSRPKLDYSKIASETLIRAVLSSVRSGSGQERNAPTEPRPPATQSADETVASGGQSSQPSGQGALHGLYRRFGVVRVVAGAMLADAYLFSSNGNYFHGWPGTQRLQDFDFRAACQKQAAQCGSYSIANGRIIFNAADGQSQDTYFRVDKAKGMATVEFGSYSWFKLVPWRKTGLRGQFKSSSIDFGFDDGRTDFPDFARASQLLLIFGADGQFEARQNKLWDNMRGNWIEPPPRSGTYALKGATLELRFGDGGSRICDLYVPEDTADKDTPDMIYVNGRPFLPE